MLTKATRFSNKAASALPSTGNTFTGKELHKSAIVTIEPENINTVGSLNFGLYGISHRLEAFKPRLLEGILDTDGDHGAASRSA